MPAQIEVYEQLCVLSARMVEAARAHDWEQLIGLEQSVADLRRALLEQPDHDPLAAPQEVDRKRDLIQRILRDDAEIRRHTEPWMEQVRRFLSGDSRKRKLDRAYGARG